jgi:hypothetical protein
MNVQWEIVVQANGYVRFRPYSRFPFAFEQFCDAALTMWWDQLTQQAEKYNMVEPPQPTGWQASSEE